MREIGNIYSDEILHRARLSPFAITQTITIEEKERLFNACRNTLSEWTQWLRKQSAGEMPEKVTAFREGMAILGQFGRSCPVCGTKIQRIRYL